MPSAAPTFGSRRPPLYKRPLLVLSLIAVMLVGVAVYLAYFKDDPPSDDSDLVPAFPPARTEANPIADFAREMAAYPMNDWDDLPAGARPWDPGQGPALRVFLDTHPTERRLFEALMQTDPRLWRWQGVDENIDSALQFTDVNLCIKSATVLGKSESFVLAQEGRHEEALEKALQLAWFGDQLARMDGTLLHQLVALSIQTMGERLVRPAVSAAPDDRLLKHAQTSLERLGRPSSSLTRVAQIEFLFAKNSPEVPDAATMDVMGVRQWERVVIRRTTLPYRTHAEYQDRVRRLIKGANQGWAELNRVVQAIGDEQRRRFSDDWKVYLRPNLGGKILLKSSWGTSGALYTRACANESLRRMTIVTLALRRHELAHGRLPGSLQELVPAYLPEVPLDPFDDLPLRWDAAKKWLYSVSEDGQDDHGDHRESEKTGFANPDLVMPYWWSPQPAKKGS